MIIYLSACFPISTVQTQKMLQAHIYNEIPIKFMQSNYGQFITDDHTINNFQENLNITPPLKHIFYQDPNHEDKGMILDDIVETLLSFQGRKEKHKFHHLS